MYNDYTHGWNNLMVAILLEISFQETCKLNSDNFNMFDRETFVVSSSIFGQLDIFYANRFHTNPKLDKFGYFERFSDKIKKNRFNGVTIKRAGYLEKAKNVKFVNIFLGVTKKDREKNAFHYRLQHFKSGKRSNIGKFSFFTENYKELAWN